jgi:hypothetical protein
MRKSPKNHFKLENELNLIFFFFYVSLQVWFQVSSLSLVPRKQPTGLLTHQNFFSLTEPSSQVAQDREVLGPIDDHGRVWTLRCDGSSLVAASRHHSQVG